MEDKKNDTYKLLYNTERVKLYIPEYGRNVQKMVDYLKTIEDRDKRNEQARAVVKVMEILNPAVHLQEDYEQKLWDHLHIISDFSLDVEKQLTKKFKMVLLYSLQQYNESYGVEDEHMTQHIAVADLLYKFTSKFSTRLELQYLHTKQDAKDWMAALIEVNFAPRWCIYASDMFNHGSTKVHYYNAGVSYNKSRTRVALAYGRYKSGFICSGGVCRQIPQYTGANFSITTSF